jgi:hypothetical protein
MIKYTNWLVKTALRFCKVANEIISWIIPEYNFFLLWIDPQVLEKEQA